MKNNHIYIVATVFLITTVSDDEGETCLEEQAQANFEDDKNSLEAVSDCSEDENSNPGKVSDGDRETCAAEESHDSTTGTTELGLSKDKPSTNDDDRGIGEWFRMISSIYLTATHVTLPFIYDNNSTDAWI